MLPKKGGLGQGATERGWGRDRAALVACKARHGGLRDFYIERDAKLAR